MIVRESTMARAYFCIVLLSSYYFAKINGAKEIPSNLGDYVPILESDGGACAKSEAGVAYSAIMKVSRTEIKKFRFSIPDAWELGEYVCRWKVVVDPSEEDMQEDESVGLKFKFFSFEYMWWWNRTGFTCRPTGMEIQIPRLEFSKNIGLCSYDRETKNVETPNDIQLELKIKKKEEYNNETFYVEMSSEEPKNWPRRYKVEEIVKSKNTNIRSFDFTWEDGRKFCKRQSPGMDLCNFENPYVCPFPYVTPFSHMDTDYEQYFPMLQYNAWAQLSSGGRCHRIRRSPLWGMDSSKCPKPEGCKAKTYIYCCTHDTPVSVRKHSNKLAFYVTSGRSPSGEYHYRFYDEANNEDHFKNIGRISGDIRRFELFEGYSPRHRTMVHFCRHGVLEGRVDPEKYRYKASLNPCERPWFEENYAYGSRRQRSGMSPIYFGQSSKGEGTRISLTPPCCGYDDSETSFMIYGIVKKSWKSKLSSRFCKTPHWFVAPSGVISSEHLGLDFTIPVTCSWRIRVADGRGIQVDYKYETAQPWPWRWDQDYLEFSNPTTSRIYGRVSDNVTGRFLSDSNTVDIVFVLEDSMANFSVSYTEVSRTRPAPVKFILDNAGANWFDARDVCTENNLEICSKNDICPTENYPYDGVRADWLLVAVGDVVNQWLLLEDEDKFQCKLLTTIQPPTNWKNQTEYFVYCCDRPQIIFPAPKPVRVNVGFHNRLGKYFWFKQGDEWDSPAYRFYYDDPYHAFEDNLETVYPWGPPSTFADAASNVVDYFTMSSDFEKGHFEQAVFFCRRSRQFGFNVMTPFETAYQLSVSGCNGIKWENDFHLYAGKQRSEKAAVELHVGKNNIDNGSVCCDSNAESFTVYVISAGKLDSYQPPSESDLDFE